MCNDSQNFVVYQMLQELYSKPEEEYELAIETDLIWQLPYEGIKEFLIPIQLVLEKSLNERIVLAFIDYYYDNQNQYPAEYQLSEIKYKLFKLVIKEELSRQNFSSSLLAFLDDTSIKTDWTYFMIKKSDEFIEKLDKKDSSMEKYSLQYYTSIKNRSISDIGRIENKCEYILFGRDYLLN